MLKRLIEVDVKIFLFHKMTDVQVYWPLLAMTVLVQCYLAAILEKLNIFNLFLQWEILCFNNAWESNCFLKEILALEHFENECLEIFLLFCCWKQHMSFTKNNLKKKKPSQICQLKQTNKKSWQTVFSNLYVTIFRSKNLQCVLKWFPKNFGVFRSLCKKKWLTPGKVKMF